MRVTIIDLSGWNLLITDRSTGESTVIDGSDPEVMDGIETAAMASDMSFARALEWLKQGESLTTCSYIRKLKRKGT